MPSGRHELRQLTGIVDTRVLASCVLEKPTGETRIRANWQNPSEISKKTKRGVTCGVCGQVGVEFIGDNLV